MLIAAHGYDLELETAIARSLLERRMGTVAADTTLFTRETGMPTKTFHRALRISHKVRGSIGMGS